MNVDLIPYGQALSWHWSAVAVSLLVALLSLGTYVYARRVDGARIIGLGGLFSLGLALAAFGWGQWTEAQCLVLAQANVDELAITQVFFATLLGRAECARFFNQGLLASVTPLGVGISLCMRWALEARERPKLGVEILEWSIGLVAASVGLALILLTLMEFMSHDELLLALSHYI